MGKDMQQINGRIRNLEGQSVVRRYCERKWKNFYVFPLPAMLSHWFF